MLRRTAALGLCVVFACNGGDSGSGLPPEKPAEQLTPDEDGVLCDAALDYAHARISSSDFTGFFCLFDGLDAVDPMADLATQKSACNAARKQCIATTTPEEYTLACEEVDDWSTCTSTVGEIERCYHESVDLLNRIIDDFTCDLVDPARAAELNEKYGDNALSPSPASCETVKQNCPQALENEDEDENGSQGEGLSRPVWTLLRGG